LAGVKRVLPMPRQASSRVCPLRVVQRWRRAVDGALLERQKRLVPKIKETHEDARDAINDMMASELNASPLSCRGWGSSRKTKLFTRLPAIVSDARTSSFTAEEEAEKRASARAKDKTKKKKPRAGNVFPSKDPFHQSSVARDPSDSLATQEHPARCAERAAQRDESHRTTGVEPEFLWNTVSKPKGQTRVQHEFDLARWKTSKCFLEGRSLGCFCVARVSCCDGL